MSETTQDASSEVTREKPRYDDVNVPVVVLVGIMSMVLTFMTIAAVQGLCYHWQRSKITSRSLEVVNLPARQYIDEQKKVLEGGDGIVSIDDAMKKVISENSK